MTSIWDGFLHGATCKNCGAELGTWHPAESYAGTYTGLCYKCQNTGVIIIHEYKLDDCKLKSYPPSSPSWRRDRETYRAYDNCPDCEGRGWNWSEFNYQTFSRHRKYCPSCFDRFYSVRDRDDYLNKRGAVQSRLYRMAQSEWIRQVLNLGLTEDDGMVLIYDGDKQIGFKAPIPDSLAEKEMDELNKRLQERYTSDLKLNIERLELQYAHVVEDLKKEKHPLE